MEQIRRLFSELSTRQKIAIAMAVLMAGGTIFALYNWQREADYQPLYKALAAEDASAVVTKLKESGVEYRLSDNGGTILVPSRKVAEMRLELAGAGLPRSGRIGFELFDKTNFGVTDFAEHVNYRRALEGELERSVISISEVEHARVHITFPKDSVFLESQQAAKASVLVRLRPGVRLSAQNVLAVTHLVASAVEGLAPESVSVLDMHGNLLSRPRRSNQQGTSEASDATLEYQEKVEHEILAKINNTLEPLLGQDRFRAGISAECDFTGGEQSEETFDPGKSVMVSSQKTEDASGTGGASGVPGTSSNLSSGGTRGGGSHGFSRRTENVAFQSSRVVRHLKLAQGGVKKMSVAILLDQDVRWEGKGARQQRVLIPPAPEKIAKIHDLIAGVIGFTPERGDKLVVDTLPFESTLNSEPPLGPVRATPKSGADNLLELVRENMRIVIAGAAIAILLLVMMVTLPFRRAKSPVRRARAEVDQDLYLPAVSGAEETPAAAMVAGTSASQAAGAPPAMEASPAANALPEPAPALVASPRHGVLTKIEVLTDEVRDAVSTDAELCTNILRGWLKEEFE